MRLLSLACAVLAASGAQAASISVRSSEPDNPATVVVQGRLNAGDGERFLAQIAPLNNALVQFQSNGGSLVTGIQIGEMIRLKGFRTLVPAGGRCASACALAWLGGAQRFMGPGALIGLHAASDPKSGQVTGPECAVGCLPQSRGPSLLGGHLHRAGCAGFHYLAE